MGAARGDHAVASNRGVAQLAEHWFPKPAVVSSILAAPASVIAISASMHRDRSIISSPSRVDRCGGCDPAQWT